MNPLITAQWLFEHINDDNLVLLDASIDFQIPAESPKDKINLIPNSIRFDYDNVFCDPDSHLPHMMPSEERFNRLAQSIGINNQSTIVVYDNSGTFASPRAWAMLQAMGHKQSYILDGGLTEWKLCGFVTTNEYKKVSKGDFNGQLNSDWFVDSHYVQQAIDNANSLTVDARGMARFLAQTPEPREGVRSGHIPNSVCIPFATLMEQHRFKSKAELSSLLQGLLDDSKQEYIFSCGSGVTACIVLVAALICDYQNLKVYDGSWTDWGTNKTLPIETS
ncbi:sulfurtransferase [Vibrio sp. LaRot3]|uniref:sulfurtransferase n=1 Tax=Vibrio sp. LaRot3 TaxID=2998829 RepID=UPI0022CE1B51|nr:sulfurtransferase [Vibrio sp. LaRot3]MDA0148251.1 sulfurtransferase [Vibrio sp. LaRot3]